MMMSVILVLFVVGLVMTAQALFDPDSLDLDDWSQYKRPVVIGASVGLINYFAPKMANLSPFMLIAMLVIFGYLCYWWKEEGSEWKEMIPFIIMVIVFRLTAMSAAVMTASLVSNDFAGIIVALPTIAAIGSVGFFLFNLFQFRHEYGIGKEKENHIASSIAAVLSLILAVSVAASAVGGQGGFINNKSFIASSDDDVGNVEKSNVVLGDTEALDGAEVDTETVKKTVTTGGEETSSGWGAHYYNDDLQEDGKVENDFNFGPNPWSDGKDFDHYQEDFALRRSNDPVLLASTCVALDCTFGTDYIGEILYEGYDERLNMLERADAAARVLSEDEELHRTVNTAVNKFLSSAKKRELKQMVDIGDQLFMNPATVSGIPGIVFYETEFDKGWCIVYTFQMKSGSNTEEQVAFHIPCGYQWCNATEKIDVKPEPKPSPEKTPKKKPTSPKKKPKKPEKKKKPEKGDSSKKKKKKKEETVHHRKPNKPSYDKDPSKAPKKNTEPNDDKGPGPNTNSGGDKSTKEQKDNSNNKSSYKEYKEDIQKKKDTNETQKKSGDSNKPSSTPKKEPAKVDNNGDKGTGNGGADKPTPKKEPAKESGSGKSINNKPGEAWGGPSD